MLSQYIVFINTATGNRETILNGTVTVSNEQRVPDTFPNKMEEISVKENHENVGDNFNQVKKDKEKDFFEAKEDIIPSFSSTSVLSTEPNEVALQAVKSQVNVGDDSSQRENTNDHLNETEEAKINPPPSSTGPLPTETESLQAFQENNEDISEAESAKITPPSSSSNIPTIKTKQLEPQAVIGDSFDEKKVTKQDTGDYPIGLEETEIIPPPPSTGSQSTEANRVITQAVEESDLDSFSQKELV